MKLKELQNYNYGEFNLCQTWDFLVSRRFNLEEKTQKSIFSMRRSFSTLTGHQREQLQCRNNAGSYMIQCVPTCVVAVTCDIHITLCSLNPRTFCI